MELESHLVSKVESKIKGPNIIYQGSSLKGYAGYETIVLDYNVQRQKLYVKCKKGNGIRVGVTQIKENYNIAEYPVGMFKHQFSYRFKDGNLFNDSLSEKFGVPVKEDDQLIMSVSGEMLTFTVNGYEQSHKIKLDVGQYYGAVSLFDGAEVTIHVM